MFVFKCKSTSYFCNIFGIKTHVVRELRFATTLLTRFFSSLCHETIMLYKISSGLLLMASWWNDSTSHTSAHPSLLHLFVVFWSNLFCFQLQDVVQTGIEGNEYVTLLSWILNTYPGHELMGSLQLNIDVSKLPPLLSEEMMQKLQDEYLQVWIW